MLFLNWNSEEEKKKKEIRRKKREEEKRKKKKGEEKKKRGRDFILKARLKYGSRRPRAARKIFGCFYMFKSREPKP